MSWLTTSVVDFEGRNSLGSLYCSLYGLQVILIAYIGAIAEKVKLLCCISQLDHHFFVVIPS